MTEEQTLPDRTPKAKRARKPAKPRAPRVKDEGILAIEREAAEKKAKYRLAQQSGGILKRITEKMLPRLAKDDLMRLQESARDAYRAIDNPPADSGAVNSSPCAASGP